jgi:tetratricopeptide (TPR) repeat protein
MANVAALKKKATEFEQKKQLDKAIAAYREVLDVYDAGGEENIDVGLYNRVGDLLVRQGNTPEGVTLYERAVDLYAEGGFFNNAIALCNKILRTSPGRASVYYKLGKISAAKGFKGDAKQNFLEYADRMQKSGQNDEAFRALKEFADLCPDQDDIRLMLAEQFTKADKKKEAIEQLQLLHARYETEGRSAEAEAAADRMKAIDPAAMPRTSTATSKAKSDDLVFIDLDAPTPPRKSRFTTAVPPIEEIAPPAPAPMPAPDEPAAAPPMEIEPTAHAEAAAVPEAPSAGGMLGLEPTAFGEVALTPEPAPMAPAEFAEIDLDAIEEAPSVTRRGTRDLALPGDLPIIAIEPRVSDGLPLLEVEPRPADGTPMFDLETTSFDDFTPPAGMPPVDLPFVDMDDDEAATPPDAPFVELPMIELDDAIELVAEPAAVIDADDAFAVDAAEHFKEIPIEDVEEAPPVRPTTSMLANSVTSLAVRLADAPDDWALHRQFAEALLDDGDRDGGLRELETALSGFEGEGDLDSAMSVADEILRLNPASVRHHQKRVEYAFRSNDKPKLVESYLELGDALLREGQADKAKVVYQRVAEMAPDSLRAIAALEAFGGTPVEPTLIVEPPSGAKPKRYTANITAESVAAEPPAPAPPASDDEYVSLGDWLREDEGPKNTRMIVEEEAPSGDEAADFADMLRKFKQGVAENVDDGDHESHYDLGVAYKEMGLIDEAISEFQVALRGTTNKVRTYEALGQCFLEKQQLPVALTILQRALHEPNVGDEQLVGVLYLLGYINESLGKHAEAKSHYERVFAVDIQFRDVGDRLNAMDQALR